MANKHKAAEPAEEPIAPDEEKSQATDISDTDTETHNETSHEDNLLVARPGKRSSGSFGQKLKNVLKSRKFLAGVGVFVAAFIVAMAIPALRYKVLGLFVQKDFSVVVLDAETNKAVSGAEVSLAGKHAQTDAEGKASLRDVKPGQATLKVLKKYYTDFSESVLVSVDTAKNHKDVRLQATGRQVPVTVRNKITGKALADVTVTVLDTTAKTDANGEATIVLPADQKTQPLTATLGGYNTLSGTIEITEQPSPQNVFSLTPSGKVYFLSKKSGKIDVVKTNLDGTDRKTVLAGTGKEQERDTILLATRDWKYLALHSRREGEKPKLYLIETATDKVTVMDEGDAQFEIVGWSNHNFVYRVTRNKKVWQSKREALKSYNADSKSITIIRETAASGTSQSNYQTEVLRSPYLLDGMVVFLVEWDNCCMAPGSSTRQLQVVEAKVGTQQLKTLRTFPEKDVSFIDAKLYGPNELYFAAYYWKAQKFTFFEYEDGQVKPADTDDDAFFDKAYPRYVQSPSGDHLFWAEARDGKNTLFVGDKDAKNEQEIAVLSEYTTYGWFTEEYLLVSKKDSELYILANAKNAQPLKITDYHKPVFSNNGYGGGY